MLLKAPVTLLVLMVYLHCPSHELWTPFMKINELEQDHTGFSEHTLLNCKGQPAVKLCSPQH